MRRTLAVAGVVLAVALAACSVLLPSPQVGRWELVSAGGASPAMPASMDLTATTMTIDTGCNAGTGSYRLDGSTLTFVDVLIAQVPCSSDPLAAQDDAFRGLLPAATLSISGDQLTLDSGRGTPVLVFRRGSGS